MAMTMKMDGLEELERMLSEVSESAQGIASLALYDGAGIVADAVNAAVDNILTAPFHYAATGSTTRLPSPEEKELLTGQRRARNGFTALVRARDAGRLSVPVRTVNLEEIMVHLEKEA